MSASAATVEAQGKLNLRLKVLAREHSGYHQLESLFLRIDLADTVRVETGTSARELHCPGVDLPKERNLAFRAAEAFAESSGWPTGFKVSVEKRIPQGGGLGGGSADAGAVLRLLNALAPKPLAADALLTLALRLGADVPFLTLDVPYALGWGRGERLLALPPLPAREAILAFAPFGVETKQAFEWYAADAPDAPSAPPPFSLDLLDRWDQVSTLAENDLEAVVAKQHPEVAQSVAAFAAAGARIARMTGSGSTCFGIFDRRLPKEPEGFPEGTRLVHTRTSTSVAPIKPLD